MKKKKKKDEEKDPPVSHIAQDNLLLQPSIAYILNSPTSSLIDPGVASWAPRHRIPI